VVSAVVLGPGTITIASKVGTRFGFAFGWLVLTASALMILMTLAAVYVGVVGASSPATRLRRRFGKTATIGVGTILFLIIALFQSTNNRALLLAAEYFLPAISESVAWQITLLVFVNILIIAAFFAAKDVYRLIESFMLLMVALMIGSFLLNAIVSRIPLIDAAVGLVPSESSLRSMRQALTGEMRAMMATTFSVAGAFYQAYLVRERRWKPSELKVRFIDSAIGIATLGFLTLMIMWTAATTLHNKVDPSEVRDIATLANSLRPTFGPTASLVFAMGIMAGACSSFIGNALIGGTIFSDSLGLGSRASSRFPRYFTILALVVGALIACLSLLKIESNVNFIELAQGLTTLGLPITALAMIWLLNNTPHRPKWLLAGTVFGFLVSCLLAVATIVNLTLDAN